MGGGEGGRDGESGRDVKVDSRWREGRTEMVWNNYTGEGISSGTVWPSTTGDITSGRELEVLPLARTAGDVTSEVLC